MNIYLLTRPENNSGSHGMLISMVVIAENEDIARKLQPEYGERDIPTMSLGTEDNYNSSWIPPSQVQIELIGFTDANNDKRRIVCEDTCDG